MADFWVSGIVSARDKMPYVQLADEQGLIAQLTMGQARRIAMELLHIAARAEVDAMVLKFCEREQLPETVAVEMMANFRDYRAELDAEAVEHGEE